MEREWLFRVIVIAAGVVSVILAVELIL